MKILLSVLLSAVLSFGAVFAGMPVRSVSVSAAETETGKNAFDDTDVNEDISAVLLSELIAEAGEDGISVYFTEYCFAAEEEENVNYGLYVYVCNVRGYDFVAEDGKNALNMAVSYDADGNPTKYANMDLHYCGQSTGINAGLLWKFRVTDEDNEILSNALEQNRLHGERRYDIAGIQLWREGYAFSNDYAVNAIYRCTGYAAGYGKYVDESTLSVTKETSETVSLDVEHAFYRPDEENEGGSDTSDSLASVYFAIPNDIIRKYGELYAVHAEYLKAVTDYIFVTGNSEVYNELSAHVGKDLSGLDLRYGFGAGRSTWKVDGNMITNIVYDHSYNMQVTSNGLYVHWTEDALDSLYYIFSAEKGGADEYTVSSDELIEYMSAYSKGKSDLVAGRYARELFSEVDEEKTDVSLSADDTLELTTVSLNWFLSSIFGSHYDETQFDVSAIQKVESVTSATQVESEYYIDESCYDDFKAYYDANSKDSAVYVFHFAVDDYYRTDAVNFDNDNAICEMDGDAYLAKQTVYLDFDIIDISLKSEEGAVTVLGVVSDPVDVISSVAAPPETDPWAWLKDFLQALQDSFNTFLAVVLLIVGIALIVFLWGPLTTLLGLLWKAICTPFKAISNAVKNRKNKRE